MENILTQTRNVAPARSLKHRKQLLKPNSTELGFQSHAYRAELTDKIKEGITIGGGSARLACHIKEGATIEALLYTHRAHKICFYHKFLSSIFLLHYYTALTTNEDSCMRFQGILVYKKQYVEFCVQLHEVFGLVNVYLLASEQY